MLHSEKIPGQIIQIIPWEKKERYFGKDSTEYGETPVDLIVIGRVKKEGDTWIKRLASKEKYDEMLLDQGLPITVEKGHDFKEGDVLELELTIKRTKKAE